MKSLFEKEALEEILQRINKIDSNSKRLWGKMNVEQMIEHCSLAMQTATGDLLLPRAFIGKVLGPFFKQGFLNDKPFPKNSITAEKLIVTNHQSIEEEKKKLISLVHKFVENGELNCTKHPHSFLGKLKPNEWGIMMYKHLDHHFSQFSN